MDKYYFIEVQTYSSVNNMGLELGNYVYRKYNHAVIHANCMNDIKADINSKSEKLQEKYPRCRPFEFKIDIYKDNVNGEHETITVAANREKEKYVLILRTTVVRKLNLETCWLNKKNI